jgi:hypothetical protein
MEISELLTALGVCVVLPVLIVWLVLRSRKHQIDRKTEIVMKAIEAGVPVDENFFKSPKKEKNLKKELLDRFTGASVTSFLGAAFLVLSLTGIGGRNSADIPDLAVPGCILLGIGIALFIAYFVGKKMLAKDIEAEEKALTEKSEEQ